MFTIASQGNAVDFGDGTDQKGQAWMHGMQSSNRGGFGGKHLDLM